MKLLKWLFGSVSYHKERTDEKEKLSIDVKGGFLINLFVVLALIWLVYQIFHMIF